MAENKEPEATPEQIARVIDIEAAQEWVKKFYPGLWDRVKENDILHLLTLGHMLYKSNPEYLEATTNSRRMPTQ